MTIQDIINEVFESEEMKDYLCEHVGELYKRQIRKMIAAAPTVTLQRKLEIFEWLAESEDLEAELADAGEERGRKFVRQVSYAEIAKNTRDALDALHDTTTPAVFLVEPVICCNDDRDDFDEEGAVLFTGYEKASAYMREYDELYGEDTRLWYNVEKWELDESGDLNKTWSYTVFKEQICFCSHSGLHHGECTTDLDVNLPVPFQAGDIIEIHDMPFARKRHVLLLDIGDNWDCCSVWQMYVTEDGYICADAFKHGFIFSDCWDATSPLYRAKTFQGVLNQDEEVLYRIRDFMGKIPESERWDQIWKVCEYLSDNKIHSRDITEEFLESIGDELFKKKH